MTADAGTQAAPGAGETAGAAGAAEAGAAAGWFRTCFGAGPESVWHAPGRVNLIGEHTDYDEGFVLPFALRSGIRVAAALQPAGAGDVLELCSRQVPGQRVAVPLTGLAPGSVTGWAAYAAGVAWALRAAGHDVGGARLAIDADLPSGAGLASSAALECAVAMALTGVWGIEIPAPELATLARRAENDFAGVPCGIMDQSASLLCRRAHALLIDCRTQARRHIPLELAGTGLEFMVLDTRVRHALTDGAYGDRRRAAALAARLLGVRALRDVADPSTAIMSIGDRSLRRRARHVITENHRVRAVVGLLRAGAIGAVGALLNASHLSLRDDYEVSWPAADVAVAAAAAAGALGARMVGAGFGGCVLALVRAGTAATVAAAVTAEFTRRGWASPIMIPASAQAGARRLA